MSDQQADSPSGNPFSTRYVRPGAIEYQFPAGVTAETLVARLRENGWRGEIVGPHGSGKSTLLAALLPRLAQAGRHVVSFALHDGERRLPVSAAEAASWDGETLVVVDGYEQLGWWSRRWLDLTCRARGAGLLVTAHESVGLPLLFTTGVSQHELQILVSQLLPAGSMFITPADVAEAHAKFGANTRELLFALYDLYELRRR